MAGQRQLDAPAARAGTRELRLDFARRSAVQGDGVHDVRAVRGASIPWSAKRELFLFTAPSVVGPLFFVAGLPAVVRRARGRRRRSRSSSRTTIARGLEVVGSVLYLIGSRPPVLPSGATTFLSLLARVRARRARTRREAQSDAVNRTHATVVARILTRGPRVAVHVRRVLPRFACRGAERAHDPRLPRASSGKRRRNKKCRTNTEDRGAAPSPDAARGRRRLGHNSPKATSSLYYAYLAIPVRPYVLIVIIGSRRDWRVVGVVQQPRREVADLRRRSPPARASACCPLRPLGATYFSPVMRDGQPASSRCSPRGPARASSPRSISRGTPSRARRRFRFRFPRDLRRRRRARRSARPPYVIALCTCLAMASICAITVCEGLNGERMPPSVMTASFRVDATFVNTIALTRARSAPGRRIGTITSANSAFPVTSWNNRRLVAVVGRIRWPDARLARRQRELRQHARAPNGRCR